MKLKFYSIKLNEIFDTKIIFKKVFMKPALLKMNN